jgi:hypothetical protein
MSTAVLTDTTFSMDFDFTSSSQAAILGQLQAENFVLLAYKGATGSSQVTAGLPTWFAVPFGDLFGVVAINYTPQYKVYVFNQATIAANTVIQMEVLSDEIGLGTSLNFSQEGQFTSAGTSPAGTITLTNQRPAGTPNVTVGLAGLVNLPTGSQYLPFCAFTLTPLGSIEMAPIERVAMMAAQMNVQSGNVQANASAPGCSFAFNSSDVLYKLMVEPSTFTITSQPGGNPVTPLTSGQALSFLNG